jgi:hypothetical protein
MIGAKAGDRVAFVGPGQAGLAAELALTTGLNGETLVIGPAGLRAQFEAAAAHAGSLVEFAPHESGPLPLSAGAFDVAVWAGELTVLPESERAERLRELVAGLRPGGRIVVIDGSTAPRRFGASKGPSLPADTAIALLSAAGALAARSLGSAEGLTYYEARTSR